MRFGSVRCLFTVVLACRVSCVKQTARVVEAAGEPIQVHRNSGPASVTIEDGFGFEAVCPCQVPYLSLPAGLPVGPSGFFLNSV